MLNIFLFFDGDTQINKWYWDGIENDTWFPPIYLLIFTLLAEIVPMGAQLLSLKFSVEEKLKAIQFFRTREDIDI